MVGSPCHSNQNCCLLLLHPSAVRGAGHQRAMVPSKRLCYHFQPLCFQYPGGGSPDHLLCCFRLFSATTNGASRDPSPPPTPSIVEYLVTSCGFSGGDAAKVSASLPHMKASERANAVVQFLRQKGLGEDNIRRAVLSHPRVLRCHVGKTLEPKTRALQESGFSSSDIARLLSANPRVLRVAHLETKINYWKELLGDKDLILKVMSDGHVATSSLDSKIKPNVLLLRETGIDDHRIARIIARKPRMFACRMEKIRSLIGQVQSMGISSSSKMFELALCGLSYIRKTKLDAKVKVFKSFGWSDDDFLCAFRKNPHNLVNASEKKIREVFEFLIGEVGCEPSYIALHPGLLSRSLEKRLMPRHDVLKILRSKGISKGHNDFHGIVLLTDKSFMDRYVLPYSNEFPELLEPYFTIASERNAKTT